MVGRSTSIVSISRSDRNSRLFWSAMVHQALHQRRENGPSLALKKSTTRAQVGGQRELGS